MFHALYPDSPCSPNEELHCSFPSCSAVRKGMLFCCYLQNALLRECYGFRSIGRALSDLQPEDYSTRGIPNPIREPAQTQHEKSERNPSDSCVFLTQGITTIRSNERLHFLDMSRTNKTKFKSSLLKNAVVFKVIDWVRDTIKR